MKMQLQERFYVELKNAIRCHYNELITRCGVDTIYGYAILTDDCVSSIGPVANKERLIKVNKSDPLYNYYRYGAVEWSEWDDFGMFDEANNLSLMKKIAQRLLRCLHVGINLKKKL